MNTAALMAMAALLGSPPIHSTRSKSELRAVSELQLRLERSRLGGPRAEVLEQVYRQLRDAGYSEWLSEVSYDCWYRNLACATAAGAVERADGDRGPAFEQIKWLVALDQASKSEREKWLAEGLRNRGPFPNDAFAAQAIVRYEVEPLIERALAAAERLDWWMVAVEHRMRVAGENPDALLRLVREIVAWDVRRLTGVVEGNPGAQSMAMKLACQELRRLDARRTRDSLESLMREYDEVERKAADQLARKVDYKGPVRSPHLSEVRSELARIIGDLGNRALEKARTGKTLWDQVRVWEDSFVKRGGDREIVLLTKEAESQ